MRFSWRRVAVLVAVAAGLALGGSFGHAAVAPAPASAYVNSYNCGYQAVGHWCLYNVRHHYYQNWVHRADHSVCSKFILDNGSDVAFGCAWHEVRTYPCACDATRPLSYN